MSDSIEKFQNYKFSADQNYQNYLQSLYPTPPYQKLEKLKRKWYKKNIDPEFDTEFDSQNEQQQQNNQQQQQQNDQQQQQQQNNNDNKGALSQLNIKYHIEGQAKIFFFPAVIFGQYFMAKLLIIVVSIFQIIRNKGMIKFNVEYAQKALPTEFASNIFWAIALLVPPGRTSYLWFLPIALQMLSGVAEYMQTTNHIVYRKFQIVRNFLQYIKTNRAYLLQIKQKLEIYLLFYTIIGIFLGLSTIIQVILMVQYIGVKNKLNKNMQFAHYEFTQWLQQISNQGGPIGLVVGKFLWGYQKVLSFI